MDRTHAHGSASLRSIFLPSLRAGDVSVTASAGRPSTGRLADWLALSRDERDRAVQSCLERIRALDPSIHAWVQVAPQDPAGDGPLAGIPFGAKDIIETRGLATQYGSPIYEGRIGVSDAAIIGELRTRGAILMGKTHTTAFAYRTPAPTRNPHNLQHTPGGSSSGSAAAVAAGMVPLALGTQTQGSVLRPASFCGIAGFKPTYGLVSMDGVLPFATSLDTLGFFTATAADMLALWNALGYETDVGRVPRAFVGIGPRTRHSGSPTRCPTSSLLWPRHFRTLCLACARRV